MLTSLMSIPALAAPVSIGENGKTIYLSVQCSSTNSGADTITSVSAKSQFSVLVNFSNNPATANDSIHSFSVCLGYDSAKMTPTNSGGLATTKNLSFNSNTVFFNGANADGYVDNDTGDIITAGRLQWVRFEAKEDLTEADLSSIKILSKAVGSAEEKETMMADGKTQRFTIIQTPALSVAMKSGAKIYTSSTPEEIAGLIDVTYIDATGTPSAIDASDVTVTLPAGGLKAGTNTLTATANGVNCTFEATVLEDSLTGIEIDHAPTKVDYTAFENFDPAGMVVTATYASGKTADVTASCTFAPSTALEVTDKQVTVTYQGQTDTQDITVSPKSITGAEITLDTIPTYSGEAQSVSIASVTVDGRTLDSGDYDITSGSSATDVASTTLVITGKGNYKETASLDWQLEKAALTLPSASVEEKTYNGNDAATIKPGDLSGIVSGDDVSVAETKIEGTFDNEFVGTGKDVDPTGAFTLKGEQKGNYTLTQPSGLTGNITTATQTITAEDKTIVKNGVGRDISGWANSNATGAEITYTLVGTPAGITLTSGNILTAENAASTVESFTIKVNSGAVDVNKDGTPEYSAATEQTITVTVTEKEDAGVSIENAPTSKTYGDEDFTITAKKTCPDDTNGVWSWTSSDPAVLQIVSGADTSTVTVKVMKASPDTGATLTVSYTSDNYYDTAAATIKVDKKGVTITGLSAENKVYDGSKTATVTGTPEISGKVNESDELTVNSGSASFADANAGNGKIVTFSGYTLTGAAIDNYTLSAQPASVKANITPKPVTVTGVTATDRAYNGTTTVALTGGTVEVKVGTDDVTVDLTNATGSIESADAADTAKAVTVTGVALAGAAANNYELSAQPTGVTVTISKAAAKTLADITIQQKFTVTTEQTKVIGSAGMPADAGTLSYAKGSETHTGTVTVSWDVNATTGDVKFTLTEGAAGAVVTLPVTITSTNYADSTVKVVITLTEKDPQAALTINSGTTVTYGQTLTLSTTGGSGTGAVSYSVTNGTGEATVSGNVLTPVKAGTVTVTATKASDADYNEVTSEAVTITINKATPTGQPAYTKITTSGKTLADAALNKGTIAIEGSIRWVDAEGNPLDGTTAVTANTAYRWVFTPADPDNYETLTGSITPYVVHSSSGGSGSSAYSITVESDKNGTVTVSPKSARKGTTVTITVKPDEGFELDTLRVYDKDGNKIKVTEVKNGKYTFTMPASKVTVKVTFAEIESTWPFVDVAEDFWARDSIAWAYENGYMNGTSATTFNPGGSVTRQQLWMILARLSGERPANMAEARVWAVENGISDGSNPGNAVSRQQMVTILYRYAHLMGYKTSGSAALDIFPDSAKVAPYAQDAMAWSVANGIVGGTTQGTLNPGGTANRAQFATILQRFCKNIVED